MHNLNTDELVSFLENLGAESHMIDWVRSEQLTLAEMITQFKRDSHLHLFFNRLRKNALNGHAPDHWVAWADECFDLIEADLQIAKTAHRLPNGKVDFDKVNVVMSASRAFHHGNLFAKIARELIQGG